MENFVANDLRIECKQPPGAPLELVWRGKSNDRHPGKLLHPFFATVLDEAAKTKAQVAMRFEKLEHFNSSTITALIQFIQDARARGVKMTISFDPTLRWQKLSFDALKVFATDSLLEFQTV